MNCSAKSQVLDMNGGEYNVERNWMGKLLVVQMSL